MKSLYFVLLISIFTFSCSSDDSTDSTEMGNTNVPVGDYFPVATSNSWTYSVVNTSPTNPEFDYNETDIVTINSNTTNSFTIDVNAPTDTAFGTVNSIFNSGSMTKSNTSLTYTGEVGLFSELESVSNTSATLTDFSVYDIDASDNSTLDTVSDTFTQNENFDGIEVPVTSNYTITSTKVASLNTLSVNNISYTDVVHAKIMVNLSVVASIDLGGGIISDINILNPQNVVVIDSYFAKDIGLIKSVAVQSFTVNNGFIQILGLIGITDDFATSGSVTNTQDITSYNISE